MTDKEKNNLPDTLQQVERISDIDNQVNDFDKKSEQFVEQVESQSYQKANQDVIAEFEHKEKESVNLDELNTSYIWITKDNKLLHNTNTLQSTISSLNPESSPQANKGREESYNKVQSQISSLPFGLDRFFADV